MFLRTHGLPKIACEWGITQNNCETGVIIVVVTDDFVHADGFFQVLCERDKYFQSYRQHQGSCLSWGTTRRHRHWTI